MESIYEDYEPLESIEDIIEFYTKQSVIEGFYEYIYQEVNNV